MLTVSIAMCFHAPHMQEGYTKLFSSITDSTIWLEDLETRIVWITLLAMCNGDGYVGAALPGIAHRARVSLEATERAMEKFMSPDPHSRSQEHEGRRIAKADRGWVILNYLRFRAVRDADARREQNRQAKRRSRAKSKQRREAESFDGVAGGLAPDHVYEEQETIRAGGNHG